MDIQQKPSKETGDLENMLESRRRSKQSNLAPGSGNLSRPQSARQEDSGEVPNRHDSKGSAKTGRGVLRRQNSLKSDKSAHSLASDSTFGKTSSVADRSDE